MTKKKWFNIALICLVWGFTALITGDSFFKEFILALVPIATYEACNWVDRLMGME